MIALYEKVTPLAFAVHASDGQWVSARHLEYLDTAIIDAIEGHRPERVIIIEAPPRHGKSEYISHWLPSWYLGAYPDRRVMMASYSDKFARKWGRAAKETLTTHGPAYFGINVSKETRAANEWDISGRRGGMTTAGIGGSLTGRGADLLIIDDPIKNAEEAISETLRESQWEWWQSTAWTRLEPGGIAIVMMTRWHEDDLIGRLIKWSESRNVGIRRICLPAYAGDDDLLGRKPGEPLWPERLPVEELELRRSMLDAYWWESLYQQRPGSYGKNDWPASYFEGIWAEPHEWPDAFDASVIALDPSKGGDAKRGDYAACVWLGLGRGFLWVNAQVRRRPVELLCDESVAFAQALGCDYFGVESNAFQYLLEGPLDQACEDAGGVPLPIGMINNSVKKSLRISRLGPWLARGKFKFARNPDTELLVDQLRGFPFAEHDDGPDALEMALRLLRWFLGQGGVDADDIPEEVLSG